MKFDVYYPFTDKEGKKKPGIKATPKTWEEVEAVMKSPYVSDLVKQVREGDKAKKTELPAICFTGHSKSGKRLDSDMEPTQYVMIDIDHVEDVQESYKRILQDMGSDQDLRASVGLIHITPSGHGLRIVFRATQDYATLSDHMSWFGEKLELGQYGEFDTKVKNIGRLSFLVPYMDILYLSKEVMTGERDFGCNPIDFNVEQVEKKEKLAEKPANGEGRLFDNTSVSEFTEEEIESFKKFDYRGIDLPIIISKYVEVYGTPTSGEIHNYYNDMVKNFRCICDNNKRLLLYLLPRFGHTIDECWSQIVSICRVNTLSRLPKSFYFFLKENGFYEPRGKENDNLKAYMMSEEVATPDRPPYLPPVFRELVNIAPIDFVLPCVNSLLPILGTLTSYLKAVYPYDNRDHTTSFFSIIYAPPGTGKGFVERYMDLLFEDLKLRDYVQSERENVYIRILQRKGDNEKSPDMPHTSLRLIPPKNSEAEFLQKQMDNHGYHMFTYAAEMDSWAKGVRAAGGNKDDMIRIAWDNGEYGQQFKSVNTFKGMVRLYWNVLITGTLAQVNSYFKNVENGLVTRCSFTSIDNQEFAEPPVWKQLSKRNLETIRKFMKRCDERTYKDPCTITIGDLEMVNDDDFDKEVDWRFKFRERREVDMSWIMPTIEEFHKEQMKKAALDVDSARDVFRRRVAVRGFRLGLICYGLWENPRPSDLEKCKSFIWWWMHKDIESTLNLWGKKYNEVNDVSPVMVQRTVFDNLEETFTKNDVYVVCMKQGIKTPIRRIIFDWKKLGYLEQINKETYKKKKL